MGEQGPDSARLRASLLEWYRRSARVLPWRSDPTPYHVLLSELMLQQTRVDTVIPYYERFLSRWPRLEDLAAADDEAVLEAWAGLGYYSRARNLLAAARAAAAAGGLPAEAEALQALPGVGPYTAGAVSSIAFGREAPLVDGNVERVLSRIYALDEDPRSKPGRARLWALAGALVRGEGPGDFNQAMMELGAMVCAPKTPACSVCPVVGQCVAFAQGRPSALPVKAKKAPPRAMRGVAGLLVREGRVLMGRRPPTGLLAGLWEPVGAEITPEQDPFEQVVLAFRERAGVPVLVSRRLGEVVHVFTHRRLVLDVFEVESVGPLALAAGGYDAIAWVDPASPGRGLSTLARRTLALMAEGAALALPFAAEGER